MTPLRPPVVGAGAANILSLLGLLKPIPLYKFKLIFKVNLDKISILISPMNFKGFFILSKILKSI